MKMSLLIVEQFGIWLQYVSYDKDLKLVDV